MVIGTRAATDVGFLHPDILVIGTHYVHPEEVRHGDVTAGVKRVWIVITAGRFCLGYWYSLCSPIYTGELERCKQRKHDTCLSV